MTCLAAAVSACLLLAAPGWAQSPTDATAAAQSAAAVPAMRDRTRAGPARGRGFAVRGGGHSPRAGLAPPPLRGGRPPR
ncbi:ShlB/FhaC/HecB family hemolysin secretion/activation protein, partial [Xanthomonas perforans]